jgi:hypothetical protein
LVIVAIVLIGLLVTGAGLLYHLPKGDRAFGRSVADGLLQVAFLVLAGTVLDRLIKSINGARDKEHERRDKRMDLMRRMREAHVRIANAQRHIYASPSRRTYRDQMRVFMLTIPELEDIERDVAATTDLFCKESNDKEDIREGIRKLVEYLNTGYHEYAEWNRGKVQQEWSREAGMDWIAKLGDSRCGMPKEYMDELTKSKGKIRSYVYGDGIGENEPDACTATVAGRVGALHNHGR